MRCSTWEGRPHPPQPNPTPPSPTHPCKRCSTLAGRPGPPPTARAGGRPGGMEAEATMARGCLGKRPVSASAVHGSRCCGPWVRSEGYFWVRDRRAWRIRGRERKRGSNDAWTHAWTGPCIPSSPGPPPPPAALPPARCTRPPPAPGPAPCAPRARPPPRALPRAACRGPRAAPARRAGRRRRRPRWRLGPGGERAGGEGPGIGGWRWCTQPTWPAGELASQHHRYGPLKTVPRLPLRFCSCMLSGPQAAPLAASTGGLCTRRLAMRDFPPCPPPPPPTSIALCLPPPRPPLRRPYWLPYLLLCRPAFVSPPWPLNMRLHI